MGVFNFEANSWKAKTSSIGRERQFDSQIGSQASTPTAKRSPIPIYCKEYKFEIRNKLDQLQGMSAKMATNRNRIHARTKQWRTLESRPRQSLNTGRL